MDGREIATSEPVVELIRGPAHEQANAERAVTMTMKMPEVCLQSPPNRGMISDGTLLRALLDPDTSASDVSV